MNTLRTVWLIVLLLAFLGCTQEKKQKIVEVKASNIVQKRIGVEGMTCVGCEVTLEKALSKVEGVVKVKASAKHNEAYISYDKSKTDKEAIAKEIKEAGYKVTP